MCSAPWYAASSPERSANTAGAIEATDASNSRATGRSPDSRRPRTSTAAPSIETSVYGLSIGSFAAGSLDLICGRRASASKRRAGPRRSGLLIRDAWMRFRAETTSICPSSSRIAHAQTCGPCTSTPFGRAMPPSRIVSSAIVPKGSGSAQNRVRRVAKPTDRELEVGDGNALISRMDERRSHLGRQLARRGEEAVGDGAERLAQPVTVGETGADERGRTRSRLGFANPLLERPPQRRVERRASAAAPFDPLELVVDVGTPCISLGIVGSAGDASRIQHGADHRLDVLRMPARQQPAVHLEP